MEDFLIDANGRLKLYTGKSADIVIPDGVKIIGAKAFLRNYAPVSVTLPEGVTRIESFAFREAFEMNKIVLPSTLTQIGENAFSLCLSLTEFTIPANLEKLGSGAFMGCRNLKRFNVDPANVTFYEKDGVLFSNTEHGVFLVSCPPTLSGEYLVPDGTAGIGDYAFYGCDGITRLVLPDSVEQLSEYSFGGFTRINEVILPVCFADEDVRQFGKTMTFTEKGGEKNKSETGADFVKNRTVNRVRKDGMDVRTIDGIRTLYKADEWLSGTVVIPDGVERIGDNAFERIKSISEVFIPSTVQTIGDHSFSGCVGLKKLHIENGLRTIGKCAFFGCTELENVIIPEGVRIIDREAFKDCVHLKRIDLPKSLVGINDYAFEGCLSLDELVAPNVLDPYVFRDEPDYFSFCSYISKQAKIFGKETETKPVALPRFSLVSCYGAGWKKILTLGFLKHPELYGSFDLFPEKEEAYFYLERLTPYRKYALTNKKKLTPYIFEKDDPGMLRFYSEMCGFKRKDIEKSFLFPAMEAGAKKCVDYIRNWLERENAPEPIAPAKDEPSASKFDLSFDDALRDWRFAVVCDPDPEITLTECNIQREKEIVIPDAIGGIPVTTVDKDAFWEIAVKPERLNKNINKSDTVISAGKNLRKINAPLNLNKSITLTGPVDSAARIYAAENGLNFIPCDR